MSLREYVNKDSKIYKVELPDNKILKSEDDFIELDDEYQVIEKSFRVSKFPRSFNKARDKKFPMEKIVREEEKE